MALRCKDGAPTGRYLSKNNGNIARLDMIKRMFPDFDNPRARPSPLAHAALLHRQHTNFLKRHAEDSFARRYINDIGQDTTVSACCTVRSFSRVSGRLQRSHTRLSELPDRLLDRGVRTCSPSPQEPAYPRRRGHVPRGDAIGGELCELLGIDKSWAAGIGGPDFRPVPLPHAGLYAQSKLRCVIGRRLHTRLVGS